MGRSQRFCVFVLIAAAALSLPAARADVFKLRTGGQVKGSLQEVVFLQDGNRVKYARARLGAVWLSQTGRDRLDLADGTAVEGEIVSATIRTVGGPIAFERNDLSVVTMESDPETEAKRRELAEKKAELDPKDAVGLFELSQWCESKKLKTEAAELARASLEIDPEHEDAEQAHLFLGHVLHEDQWITLAELLKTQEEAEEAENKGKAEKGSAEAKEEEEKLDSEADEQLLAANPDLTPEQIEDLTEALTKNARLGRAYLKRSNEIANKELERAKKKYMTQWNNLRRRAQQLAKIIKQKEKQSANTEVKIKTMGTVEYGTGSSAGATISSPFKEADTTAERQRLTRTKKEITKVVEIMKAVAAGSRARRRKREARVKAIYQAHRKQLLSGKNLGATGMVKNYRSALKD